MATRRGVARASPVQVEARRQVIGARLVVQLDDVDGVAGVRDIDAHSAWEFVAADAGMDEMADGRAAHAAGGVVGLLVPRAGDLAALVFELGLGV